MRMASVDAIAIVCRDGKIFQHGTGHGVGAFLNVHEGPQGISYRARAYKGGFVQGMTTSNEVRALRYRRDG